MFLRQRIEPRRVGSNRVVQPIVIVQAKAQTLLLQFQDVLFVHLHIGLSDTGAAHPKTWLLFCCENAHIGSHRDVGLNERHRDRMRNFSRLVIVDEKSFHIFIAKTRRANFQLIFANWKLVDLKTAVVFDPNPAFIGSCSSGSDSNGKDFVFADVVRKEMEASFFLESDVTGQRAGWLIEIDSRAQKNEDLHDDKLPGN